MKKMRRLWTWIMGCALMLPVLMPSLALAAKKKADVVIVADTRKLDGFLYWWAEMYNESHFFFAILTMIIIPILGCILGPSRRRRHVAHRHRPQTPRTG